MRYSRAAFRAGRLCCSVGVLGCGWKRWGFQMERRGKRAKSRCRHWLPQVIALLFASNAASGDESQSAAPQKAQPQSRLSISLDHANGWIRAATSNFQIGVDVIGKTSAASVRSATHDFQTGLNVAGK